MKSVLDHIIIHILSIILSRVLDPDTRYLYESLGPSLFMFEQSLFKYSEEITKALLNHQRFQYINGVLEIHKLILIFE